MSTPEELADQASEALDAGGPDAQLSALRALTDAVREQTKAIASLAERFGAGGGGDAAATRCRTAEAADEAAGAGASLEGRRHVGAPRPDRR